MTDATYATVIDAVFAMNAYEHDPDDGAWSNDLALFFSSLDDDQLGTYFVTNTSTQSDAEENNFFAIAYTSPSRLPERSFPIVEQQILGPPSG